MNVISRHHNVPIATWGIDSDETDGNHERVHLEEQASCLLHREVIFIAHNFKGYNGQFILNYLVHTVYITPTGTTFLDRKFLDSYNFLLFALSKMPLAVGLTETKKG